MAQPDPIECSALAENSGTSLLTRFAQYRKVSRAMIRLKTGDVARLLAVSRERIVAMESRGDLPPALRMEPRGDRVWDWASLKVWLDTHGIAYYPQMAPPAAGGLALRSPSTSGEPNGSSKSTGGEAAASSSGGSESAGPSPST